MSPAPRTRPLALELACFAALASFVTLQWTSLVAGPPLLRAAAGVALATGAGAALALLPGERLSRAARWSLGALIVLAALALCMVAMGLPAGMLRPGSWGTFAANVEGSLGGIADLPTPYQGTDVWLRLTILLAVPPTLVLAAAAAFAPRRLRQLGRLAAIVLLTALYLGAVGWHQPEAQLLRGALLLLLLAAWLWLPGLPRRRLLAATATVAVAAAVSLPVAARVQAGEPLLDYRSWRLFSESGVGFGWSHSYGPLDWPQKGTVVLKVQSDEPFYWKATTLDSFDGTRWLRSDDPEPEPVLGQPYDESEEDLSPEYLERISPWVEEIDFDVRGLRSDVVVGAGTVLGVRDVDAGAAEDATWEVDGELEPGDSYSVLAYVPDPSPNTLRDAGTRFPRTLRRYTAFSLPAGSSAAPTESRAPFWRPEQGSGPIGDRVEGTAYEQMFRLARDLTVGAATPYDATVAVETYLRETYAYEPQVPQHGYPLPAFLFEDRRGYCQQFSGAMALMLRMVGIPSRVASGFAPGVADLDGEEFLVQDIDAHAWVEVFFPSIGWVAFEPTPGDAPAASQQHEEIRFEDDPVAAASLSSEPPSGAAESPEEAATRGGDEQAPTDLEATGTGTGEAGGFGWARVAAPGISLLLVGTLLAYLRRDRRRRRLGLADLTEAELDELRRALDRLGWSLTPATTLVELERRLELAGAPAAAGYVAQLRRSRYETAGTAPPGPRARRALRRALLAAGGRRGIGAALLGIPPGGPRPGR